MTVLKAKLKAERPTSKLQLRAAPGQHRPDKTLQKGNPIIGDIREFLDLPADLSVNYGPDDYVHLSSDS